MLASSIQRLDVIDNNYSTVWLVVRHLTPLHPRRSSHPLWSTTQSSTRRVIPSRLEPALTSLADMTRHSEWAKTRTRPRSKRHTGKNLSRITQTASHLSIARHSPEWWRADRPEVAPEKRVAAEEKFKKVSCAPRTMIVITVDRSARRSVRSSVRSCTFAAGVHSLSSHGDNSKSGKYMTSLAKKV